MTAPWVQAELNPGWIGSQPYKPGELLEIHVYDEKLEKQGKALVEVLDTLRRSSTSVGYLSRWFACFFGG